MPIPQAHGHMYMAHLIASGQSGDEIDLIEFIGDESDDPGQPQHQEVLHEPVTSILDRLRPPLRSELYRKRELEKPVTNNKKHKAEVANTIDPNTVTPATRVKEFPGKSLAIRSKQLSNYTDTLSCQHRTTTTSSEDTCL